MGDFFVCFFYLPILIMWLYFFHKRREALLSQGGPIRGAGLANASLPPSQVAFPSHSFHLNQ